MPNSEPVQNVVIQPKSTTVKDERWLTFYHCIRRMMTKKLQRNMEQLYISNIEDIRSLASTQTIILAPNHVAYWDSCIYFILSHELSARSFVYVAQSTLRRLSFLRWCGAIPINTASTEQAVAQLRSAVTLNTDPTQFWIFPQGEHRPTTSPVRCKKGVQILASSVEACIVPVSIQYIYRDGEQPIAYVRFQPPLPSDATLSDVDQSLQEGLQWITDAHVHKSVEAYTPYFKDNRLNDDIPTKILSWIAKKILGDV